MAPRLSSINYQRIIVIMLRYSSVLRHYWEKQGEFSFMITRKRTPNATSTSGVKRSDTRFRWVLAALALSFVLWRSLGATSALFGEVGQVTVTQGPQPTIVLPTTNPQATPHVLTAAEYANLYVRQMSLNDKVGQMIMIKLLGQTLNSDEQIDIAQYHVGGVIAFGDALYSVGPVKQLVHDMQAASPTIPLWVGTDEEGGVVTRLTKVIVGSRPGEQDIGNSGDPAQAKAAGVQSAADFKSLGFNFNFAPVLDINEPGIFNTQLNGREYSSDPQTIAAFANAYLQGFQSDGTLVAGIKHFPGLGGSPFDPHTALPIINKTQAELEGHELIPYRSLLTLGNVKAVMVTHEYLPKIDNEYPASLSAKITTGILRDKMGFDGVIVTDSLDMEALSRVYPVDQSALLAAEAGADVLMMPYYPTTDVKPSIDAIINAVQSGKITMEHIDASVRRILTLKIEMGLIKLPQAVLPASSPTATTTPPILTPSVTTTPTKKP